MPINLPTTTSTSGTGLLGHISNQTQNATVPIQAVTQSGMEIATAEQSEPSGITRAEFLQNNRTVMAAVINSTATGEDSDPQSTVTTVTPHSARSISRSGQPIDQPTGQPTSTPSGTRPVLHQNTEVASQHSARTSTEGAAGSAATESAATGSAATERATASGSTRALYGTKTPLHGFLPNSRSESRRERTPSSSADPSPSSSASLLKRLSTTNSQAANRKTKTEPEPEKEAPKELVVRRRVRRGADSSSNTTTSSTTSSPSNAATTTTSVSSSLAPNATTISVSSTSASNITATNTTSSATTTTTTSSPGLSTEVVRSICVAVFGTLFVSLVIGIGIAIHRMTKQSLNIVRSNAEKQKRTRESHSRYFEDYVASAGVHEDGDNTQIELMQLTQALEDSELQQAMEESIREMEERKRKQPKPE